MPLCTVKIFASPKPRVEMGDSKHSFSLPYRDDVHTCKRDYAESLDAHDPLHYFREQFIIPSKEDLSRKTLAKSEGGILISEELAGGHSFEHTLTV